jgi:hypothetical protein
LILLPFLVLFPSANCFGQRAGKPANIYSGSLRIAEQGNQLV